MSAKTIKEFSAELRTRNIARPNLYHVSVLSPKALLGQDTNLVSMWCSGASTPQTTILTNDNFIESGVRRKYAYDLDWSDLTLTFYLDQDYKIKNYFDKWKQAIVPYNRNFGYSDDYTAESLILTIINQDDKDAYRYEFHRVYPKTVSPVELSYANGNSISTFYVDFVFEDYYFTELNAKTGSEIYTSKPNYVPTVDQGSYEQVLAMWEQYNSSDEILYSGLEALEASGP